MRLLLVVPETPETGGGGIATYVRHATAAFEQAGHEVFTLTWLLRDRSPAVGDASAAKRRIVSLSSEEVWNAFPRGPFHIALSYLLIPHICDFVDDVQPDVIETADFRAPLYGFLAERRAGRLPRFEAIPVIGFGHGYQRHIYSANGTLPTIGAQEEMAGERQMMRWCDLVMVPSCVAQAVFTYQTGAVERAVVVGEPFVWDSDPVHRPGNTIYHLGRLAFSKGIDHDVHFLNALEPLMTIDRVLFLGETEFMPFRISDAQEYICRRIAPALRDRLSFAGKVSQSDFPTIFSAGGYSMNFSNQETFNYAAVEMIANGVFPFIKAGTPMEDFLPPSLCHLLLPLDFNLRGLRALVDDIDTNGRSLFAEIVAHVRSVTSPRAFVNRYLDAIADSRRAIDRSGSPDGSRYTGDDVSVLMATCNNPTLIEESIESVRAQTVRPRELIIVDDGSTDPASLDTLRRLQGDPALRVIFSDSNEGLCATRMKLIEAARTPLSIFLDSDDVLSPEYVEKTLAAMALSHVRPAAVLTWRQNFESSSELLILDMMGDHYHLLKNDFRMTSLIRTDVLRQIGFTPSMRNGEADDWLFWLDFTAQGHRSVMVGEPLFRYRFAENSMSWPWSQGHAALTSTERSRRWSRMQGRLPGLALEDVLAENAHLWLSQTAGTPVAAGVSIGHAIRVFLARHPWIRRLVDPAVRAMAQRYMRRHA